VQDLRGDQGEKMPGVMCTIDAVGYEAWDREQWGDEQRPTQVIDDAVRLTNPTGHIGLIGVYFPEDPGGVDADAKHGRFPISLGEAWNKGVSFEMGQAPVKQYNVYLRDLIASGAARPSFIVSHDLPLEAAPDAYEKFDQRVDGYTKVLLKPDMRAA
jgi:glutathione-independent formaldehyde dehydrogenase